jgi:hypothetical protein
LGSWGKKRRFIGEFIEVTIFQVKEQKFKMETGCKDSLECILKKGGLPGYY